MTMTAEQIKRMEIMYQKLEICERHLKSCSFGEKEIANGFLGFAFLLCENAYGFDEASSLLEIGITVMRAKAKK